MTVTPVDPTATTERLEGQPADTATAPTGDGNRLVEEDLLVEDVSIDGMCGVY